MKKWADKGPKGGVSTLQRDKLAEIEVPFADYIQRQLPGYVHQPKVASAAYVLFDSIQTGNDQSIIDTQKKTLAGELSAQGLSASVALIEVNAFAANIPQIGRGK